MKLHVVECLDNDRHVFRGRNDVRRCPRCGELLDKWITDQIRLDPPGSIRLDISTTYDGVDIVSPRFRDLIENAGIIGLIFLELADGYAVLRASRRVAFDTAARRTTLENRCNVCGQYEAVAGATPAFLMPPVDVRANEFVWTDIEFGSGDEKSPLLICGDEAAKTLCRARFSGLDDFSEVRGV